MLWLLSTVALSTAPQLPGWPTELYAKVHMVTYQRDSRFEDTYQLWQSMKLKKSFAEVTLAEVVKVSLEETSFDDDKTRLYSVDRQRGANVTAACTCYFSPIPAQPEFFPWSTATSPVFIGTHTIHGRMCDLWKQVVCDALVRRGLPCLATLGRPPPRPRLTVRGCCSYAQSHVLGPDDEYTVAFDHRSRLPYHTFWVSKAAMANETKLFLNITSGTPPLAKLEKPSECARTNCSMPLKPLQQPFAMPSGSR